MVTLARRDGDYDPDLVPLMHPAETPEEVDKCG